MSFLVAVVASPSVSPMPQAADSALTFSNVRDVVLMLVAIATAVAAWRGLSTWRSQLEGEAEYNLAKRLLRLCFQYRDAIERVRDPFMTGHEMTLPEGSDASTMDHKLLHALGVQSAYQTRWERVTAVRAELYPELLEAEVHWNDTVNDKMKELYKLQGQLFVVIQDHITSQDPRVPDAEQEHLHRSEEIKNRRSMLYAGWGGKGDSFAEAFQDGVEAIEDFLRPKLKRGRDRSRTRRANA